MKIPELEPRGKRILAAGAALALATAAYRTMKPEGSNLTFDFSVWGEKTIRVFGDVIDDTKHAAGRIAAQLILGPNNEVLEVNDIEFSEGGGSPEARAEALERALSDPEGWSGQSTQNTLQNG